MSIRGKYKSLHPALRWTLAVVAIIIIILLILQLLIALFADEYVGDRLKESVQESSPYAVTFEDLDINLFSGSIEIHDINLSVDSTAVPDTASTVNAEIGTIDVEGIGLWALFFGDKLTVDEVVISEPVITATVCLQDKNAGQQRNKIFTALDSLIYSAVSPRFKAIEIDRFEIEDAHITALKAENADTLGTVEKLSLTLQNISLDESSISGEDYFITDNFSLDVAGAMLHLSNLYNISFNKLAVSSSNQTLQVDSLRLLPQYPKWKFGQVYGYEIDRIELLIPSIELLNIKIDKLVKNGRLEAEKLVVDNASFVDFRNKTLPFPPGREPPLPHIALRNLSVTLKIDSIEVNDAYIEYNEYWAGAPQAGTVTFEHTNGVLTNVTNYPGLIAQNIIMTMDASAQVMGIALLDTHFEFPMNTDIGFHRIEGTLELMPITALNPMLKYVAFVKVDDGKINHLEFSMTLNQQESQGELIMNYEDFKISLLNEETMKQTGPLTDIETLFANVVIVEGNTPDEGMRLGTIDFERVQRKSYWNFWWKSLFSGMKDLILD